MLRVPGMLLIGSAGRNAGKTVLACALMRRFASARGIVGIKVTAISRRDGPCPRGGKGCGACASLEGDFCITEETDPEGTKDTSRLLAAGAQRVFWLRVLSSHLAEGVSSLLARIGGDTVSICESNSLRRVVEPGLFLMVQDRDAEQIKPSARAVYELADRTVFTRQARLESDLPGIDLTAGGWVLREEAAAIVLAGGQSRRMQTDKTMLPVRGRPLVAHVVAQLRDHFSDVLLSANDLDRYRFLGLRVVPDLAPERGPLMGIASTLAVSGHELNLVVACDIPRIDIGLAHRMVNLAPGYDVVVPRTGGELTEPLFAVYRRSVLGHIHALLAGGENRVRALFRMARTRFVDLPEPAALHNLNTQEDYLSYVGTAHAAV